MIWHIQPHALAHIWYSAQRWTTFQDIGSGPCGRSSHAMAADGTSIFLLGGKLSADAKAENSKFIYVLDTSMYYHFFVISFGQTSGFKTQSKSRSRIPTPTLPTLERRPPNSRKSHQRVPRPRGNHNSRHSLCRTRMSRQKVVLLFSEKLPLENWTTPPLCRLLTNETGVRMTPHRYSQV